MLVRILELENTAWVFGSCHSIYHSVNCPRCISSPIFHSTHFFNLFAEEEQNLKKKHTTFCSQNCYSSNCSKLLFRLDTGASRSNIWKCIWLFCACCKHVNRSIIQLESFLLEHQCRLIPLGPHTISAMHCILQLHKLFGMSSLPMNHISIFQLKFVIVCYGHTIIDLNLQPNIFQQLKTKLQWQIIRVLS